MAEVVLGGEVVVRAGVVRGIVFPKGRRGAVTPLPTPPRLRRGTGECSEKSRGRFFSSRFLYSWYFSVENKI